MGISQQPAQFSINGVIDTTAPVFQNMERLANNSGCWITYDVHLGKWAVVINKAGNSIKQFDDSNIIGAVSIAGTGITDMYNSVKVNYPRNDINDEVDFVKVDISDDDRQRNEEDNVLDMNLDLCSDPVQAQHLGVRELKQSRVDLVVSFKTDYSAISLNAGDIIDITNDHLNWRNKKFRIMTLSESDEDQGGIAIDITALEYDDGVYDNDLSKVEVSNRNGIVTKGGVGTPTTPVITLYEKDSRPRAKFETVTPTGIVEGVEWWISVDGTKYKIAGTSRPFDLGTFPLNTDIDFEFDELSEGTISVKARAINSQNTGQFSSIATTSYKPVQTPDAIGPGTGVIDPDSGDNLLPGTAISTLLVLLDELISNQSYESGGVFDNVFEAFNDSVGGDPRNPVEYSSSFGGTSVVVAFETNLYLINNAYRNKIEVKYGTFIAPYTGYYKLLYNINWAATPNLAGQELIPGPQFARKNSGILVNKPWLTTSAYGTGGASGTLANAFQSQALQGFIYANARETISLGLSSAHEYTDPNIGLAVTGEALFYPYDLVSPITVPDNPTNSWDSRATLTKDSGSRRYHYDSATGRILEKGHNNGGESQSDNPYIDADDIADSELSEWSVDVTTKKLVKQRVEVEIDPSLPDLTKVKLKK